MPSISTIAQQRSITTTSSLVVPTISSIMTSFYDTTVNRSSSSSSSAAAMLAGRRSDSTEQVSTCVGNVLLDESRKQEASELQHGEHVGASSLHQLCVEIADSYI